MFRYLRIIEGIWTGTVISPTGVRWDMQGLREQWFLALTIGVIALALFLIVVIVTS
jgi:hypothetical protein